VTTPEDQPLPDDIVMVQIGTHADRAAHLLALAKTASEHHDTLTETIECVLRQVLSHLVAEIMAGSDPSKGQVPSDYVAWYVEKLMDRATLNINAILMVGEAAELAREARDGGDVPPAFYAIFPGEMTDG